MSVFSRFSVRTVLVALFATVVPGSAIAGGIGSCQGYEDILFCGELSGDCKITSTDALTALRMSVDQEEPSAAADFDRNGEVTAGDALKDLRIAVGSSPATLDCSRQYARTATNVGFYNESGARVSGGYAVGWYVGQENEELRNYLVFDISNVPGTIDSAVLRLSTGLPVYSSPNATETYALYDIDTPVATVLAGGSVPVFNDLGEGTIFGLLVGSSQLESVVTIPLNASGVAYLDGSTGQVVLGGAITTLTKGASYEYMFNSTHATNTRQLILTVD